METSPKLTVEIKAEVLQAVRQHARSNMNAEVCGVLIGVSNERVTKVEARIPGEGAAQGGAHVTFTHKTWEHIYQVKDRQFSQATIVGWYHSHPGFGVFLSEYDLFIHRNFFSNPGQIAWVYDPHSDEEGCFIWADGEIVRISNLAVKDGRGGYQQPKSEKTEVAILVPPKMMEASSGNAFQQRDLHTDNEAVKPADTPVGIKQGLFSHKQWQFVAGFVFVGVIIAFALLSKKPLNPDPEHWVLIKPGTFTMGSPASEPVRGTNERPQTQVTLSKGFWIGKYEVTQREYQAVMGSNPSRFTGNLNRPVEQVSWYDATNYCGKLTQKERAAGRLPAGYEYRLPTEAEWEYCCRAVTTKRFSYGDDSKYTQLGEYEWYNANSVGTTQPVGMKKPNAWGLCDMHGNIEEWCLDWYGPYSGEHVTDPKGPPSGSHRVLRGGTWDSSNSDCRSAFRHFLPPDRSSHSIGFRIVRASVQPTEEKRPQTRVKR